MHDLVIVGIPLLAILAGILFSRSDVKELRTEMRSEMKDLRTDMKDVRTDMKDVRTEIKDLRIEVRARFDKIEDHLGRIDADLRQFYHLTGKLEARMDAIDDKRT